MEDSMEVEEDEVVAEEAEAGEHVVVEVDVGVDEVRILRTLQNRPIDWHFRRYN